METELMLGSLDKPTLDTLKAVYTPNSKIVAVKVAGINAGKVGYVKRVLQNGNIQVTWDNGMESEIRYAHESVRLAEAGKCILQHKEEINGGCDGAMCEECGWNRDVADERIRILREYGLTEAVDGKRYLRLRKKAEAT